MASTPRSKESSNNNGPGDPVAEAGAIVHPLLQQCQAERPGVVIVSYRLGPPCRLIQAARERVETAGFKVLEADFKDLGREPVAELMRRRGKRRPLVFFIHLPAAPQDTPGRRELSAAVNALNLQRGVFYNECLCAVFWVKEQNVRLLAQHASNFLDFRLRFLDVPGEPEAAPAMPRALHNLPYPPMPFFMGRDRELAEIQLRLSQGRASAISQPIGFEGLGGVGKTRLAVEYAWRHLDDYDTVLFIRADSPLALTMNLGALSELLALPEAGLADSRERFAAVLRRLETHERWLLIIDNADAEDAADAVKQILPRLQKGHVIITSRFRRWGEATAALNLELFTEDQAVDFLLAATSRDRRETAFEEKDAKETARTLASKLGLLPLALAMAAAYIREKHISLRQYEAEWSALKRAGSRLHRLRQTTDYPLPMQISLLKSFSSLSSAARAVLAAGAWFAPDPVPINLFAKAKDHLEAANKRIAKEYDIQTSPLDLEPALDELSAYSMIEFEIGKQFTIHRLVQEVIRAGMKSRDRKWWNKQAMKIMVDNMPEEPADDVRSWEFWDRMCGHAISAAEAADKQGLVEPTSDLMNEAGQYLHAKALFAKAEPLMRRALQIDEASFGPDHPNVATAINNLAQLLSDTNRLSEAEPLMRRALQIDEASFGPDHPIVAIDLNNLAQLLQATNRLSEAEPMMRRALKTDEASLGPDHPNVAIRLNNLAQLLKETNRLSEAEPMMRRALQIDEASFGPDHPNVAIRLNNLATLLQDTNRLAEAEPLMRRALQIDETSFGPDHPNVARDLNNLAQLLKATNRLAEAEPMMRRAYEIVKRSYGEDHPLTIIVENNLRSLEKELKRA